MIDTNDCWLWAGYKNEHGYGVHYYTEGKKTKKVLAHRMSYEHFKEKIPEGLVIDHLCRITSCINPSHLEAVTNIENILRGVGFAGLNNRKTHCPKGHEYTPENTNANNGWRRCRVCDRLRQQACRDKLKAKTGLTYVPHK